MNDGNGLNTLDCGHKYKLMALDGSNDQCLQFVKRNAFKEKVQSGTTCQIVIRSLIDRVHYLHNEKPHVVNPIIILLLECSIWMFEFRAALRRGSLYMHTPHYAATAKICRRCGHTACRIHV